RVTHSFSIAQEISSPPLASNDKQETLMVVEAEIGGHLIHRMSQKNLSSAIYRTWNAQIPGAGWGSDVA
ncbi:hypothetical protein Tco_0297924, partial [Tanacetum coccineum]